MPLIRLSQFPLALAFLALAFCACSQEPDVPVADPRAHAIETLKTTDLRVWWQPYRNDDPQLLGEIVDEVAALLPKGLPTMRRRLETLVRTRIAGRYRVRMEESPEGKAFILARAQARFLEPPMAVWDTKKKNALLDYHVLPGEWKSTSRISEGLKNPPAIGTSPFLKPEVLATSLKKLVAAHPDATTYQIRYAFHAGSSLKRVLMSIPRKGRIVYRKGVTVAFTADLVPWDDLREGRVDLAKLDWDYPMEGSPGPRLPSPPKDPLPGDP